MAKPATLPRWANSPTTGRTEPPEGLKDTGATVDLKWPAQFLNWLHGLTYDWLAWANVRFKETSPSQMLLVEDDGTTAMRLAVADAISVFDALQGNSIGKVLPTCRATHSGVDTMASGGGAAVMVGPASADWDDSVGSVMYVYNAGAPKFVAPTDGKYIFEAYGRWEANAAGQRYHDVYLNNSTIVEAAYPSIGDINTAEWHLSVLMDMTKGDYVQLRGSQSSGSSLTYYWRASFRRLWSPDDPNNT